MTSARDSEQAPLLADDARDDEADSVEDAPQANGKVPKREKPRIWLRKSWNWLLNNLMATAIILLLLGGLIALLVYFAGMFDLSPAPDLTEVGFLVAYNQDSGDSDPEVPDTVCLTPACVIAASRILENVSPRYHAIDPWYVITSEAILPRSCSLMSRQACLKCSPLLRHVSRRRIPPERAMLTPKSSSHDFDQFVCEGWQEKHDLRADQEGAFTGTIMAEDSQQILRHLLESPYSVDDYKMEIDSSAKRGIFEKLQTAYNACMNEEVIKDIGSAPLLDILRKVEELFPAARPDLFPLLKNMDQKDFILKGENQLSKTLTYLTSIGMDPLISFYVTVRSRSIPASSQS